MVNIKFDHNCDNKILIDNKQHGGFSFTIIKYNNVRYFYNEHLDCSFNLDSNNYCYYIKYFYTGIYFSFYRIYKNGLLKTNILYINRIKYNTFYSYFIYNKYYTILNRKEYSHNIKSINSKKLFNCRDLYKIYSYI